MPQMAIFGCHCKRLLTNQTTGNIKNIKSWGGGGGGGVGEDIYIYLIRRHSEGEHYFLVNSQGYSNLDYF